MKKHLRILARSYKLWNFSHKNKLHFGPFLTPLGTNFNLYAHIMQEILEYLRKVTNCGPFSRENREDLYLYYTVKYKVGL